MPSKMCNPITCRVSNVGDRAQTRQLSIIGIMTRIVPDSSYDDTWTGEPHCPTLSTSNQPYWLERYYLVVIVIA